MQNFSEVVKLGLELPSGLFSFERYGRQPLEIFHTFNSVA